MKNLLLLACCFPLWLAAQTLPPGFVLDQVVDGLNPVAMTLDHHGRVWIAEKNGTVRIVNESGQLLPAPFVSVPVDDYNERGLLGIALHPDFDAQPWVYLYYTVPGASRNRLSRFLANGDFAIPNSEEILMEFDSLRSYIHNGGALLVGHDDMLYVATGEGSDPNKAPDLNSFHGKILRLHISGNIPPDNPHYSQLQGNYRAIYASGFRNPFTLTYDRQTNRLWTGDVGGGEFEEINLIQPGKDYGWPAVEGPRTIQQVPANYADPTLAYDHENGCAITAVLYLPDSFPAWPEAFRGSLIWGDYCEGFLHWQDHAGVSQVFATGMDRPVGMLVDEVNGWVYYLSRAGLGGGSPQDNTSTNQGALWKIRYIGDGPPHISRHPQSVLVPVGESVAFSVNVQGTAPLRYQWLVNGQRQENDTLAVLEIGTTSLEMNGDQIRCVVENESGRDSSTVAVLSVTSNRRPEPVITAPDSTWLFRAGETVRFSGSATDPESGALPPESLTWWVDLHHDLHTHPGAGPFAGVAEGEWTVPTVYETDPDIWYRLHLQATDSAGLTGLVTRDIHPALTMIFVDGPPGIRVNLDGRSLVLPAQTPGLIGLRRSLLAPARQIAGDSLYEFQQWDDGSTDLLREKWTPEDGMTATLLYQARALGKGTGLTGRYFDAPELDFESEPVLVREDSVINFFWGNKSPGNEVPRDYFTVRWTGEVQAVFEEAYTFTVRSDDGVRLWVNEELIIDQWVAQSPKEVSGEIAMVAGQRVPIRLEYMEIAGGAEVNLFWSSPSTPKEIIPKRQLYPEPPPPVALVAGQVWLDENRNTHRDASETVLVEHLVHLWRGNHYLATTVTDSLGRYQFVDLDSGWYQIQADLNREGASLLPGAAMRPDGRTEPFFVGEADTLEKNMALWPPDESLLLAFPLLEVFPNPTNGPMTLRYQQRLEAPVQIRVYDPMGRLVETLAGAPGAGIHQVGLELSALRSGVYLLRLEQGEYQRMVWIINL